MCTARRRWAASRSQPARGVLHRRVARPATLLRSELAGHQSSPQHRRGPQRQPSSHCWLCSHQWLQLQRTSSRARRSRPVRACAMWRPGRASRIRAPFACLTSQRMALASGMAAALLHRWNAAGGRAWGRRVAGLAWARCWEPAEPEMTPKIPEGRESTRTLTLSSVTSVGPTLDRLARFCGGSHGKPYHSLRQLCTARATQDVSPQLTRCVPSSILSNAPLPAGAFSVGACSFSFSPLLHVVGPGPSGTCPTLFGAARDQANCTAVAPAAGAVASLGARVATLTVWGCPESGCPSASDPRISGEGSRLLPSSSAGGTCARERPLGGRGEVASAAERVVLQHTVLPWPLVCRRRRRRCMAFTARCHGAAAR